jgi:parallel beta-helix repeat protein
VPFTLTAGVVNSTTTLLDAITLTVSTMWNISDTVPIYAVTPTYQVLTNVSPGDTTTTTWMVTPLIAGSGLPLRVSAEAEELWTFEGWPQVVNEPGTSPPLTIGGTCTSGSVTPGQPVTLTTYVLDETLEPLTDTLTTITATVCATPTLGYSDTVSLYLDADGFFRRVLTLPTTIPLGTYWVDFTATRPGYEEAHGESSFFVTPPLTMTLEVTPTTAAVSDPVTLTARVYERGTLVAGAGAYAEIGTPGGVVTVPLVYGGGVYTATFSPTDLGPNLGGVILGGQWDIEGTADYYGSTAVAAATMTVTVYPTCWARLNDDPTDYTTVQAAVDAASDGDVVKVAGYCAGVEARAGVTQTVYISKTLTVQGGYTTTNWITPDPDANPTTLDAQEQGRVLYITGAITPTIENLYVTGGDARLGGGMYIVTATATISNCTVQDNTAQDKENPFNDGYGGGLFLSHSDATLINNTVRNNTAVNRGGGLFLDGGSATLTNNTVQSNRAGSGGGVYLDNSAATLTNNTVQDNVAAHSPSGSYSGAGGGLYLSHSAATLISNTVQNNTGGGSRSGRGGGLLLEYSNATLISNTVQTNSAPGWVNSEGGGLFLDHSDATLINNMMRNNSTNDWGWSRSGGGLFLGESAAALSGNIVISNTSQNGGGLYLSGSDAILTNTVVADNQANSAGSGLYISDSSPQLLHATIARNGGGDGSGVYVTNNSTVALTNTILVSHTVGITVAADNTATLEATLWGTDTWGNGADWGGAGTIITGAVNLWGDPAFVDHDAGDYHISPGSAAIDVGVDAGVNDDIDGEPRPAGHGYDIGADEIQNTPPTVSGLPDQIFDENTILPITIDLWAYASDGETPVSGLTYTIEGTPPPGAGVTIDGNRYVYVNPSTTWCGWTDVTIRVTDPGGLWDSDTFRVAVTWSCQG